MYVISNNYAKLEVDSCKNFVPRRKTFTFYDIRMHIKPVWNKDKSQ